MVLEDSYDMLPTDSGVPFLSLVSQLLFPVGFLGQPWSFPALGWLLA
jgi:hypothetical protein